MLHISVHITGVCKNRQQIPKISAEYHNDEHPLLGTQTGPVGTATLA